MEQVKPVKLAPELIELYNLHIHGEIDRREFIDRAKKYAVGGLTTAAIWEILKPNYALGQQVPENDSRLKTSKSDSATLVPVVNCFTNSCNLSSRFFSSSSAVSGMLSGALGLSQFRSS